MEDDLHWQVEAACIAACPALHDINQEGWLFRAADGVTRRCNSINPLRHGPRDPSPLLDEARRFYSGHGLPILFRVPEMASPIDRPLGAAGFTEEGHTLTLLAPLRAPSGESKIVRIGARPTPEWLDARTTIAGLEVSAAAAAAGMLARLAAPAVFAVVEEEGRPASVGYAVLVGRLLVLEAIATHPDLRGRGHGRALVAALLDWGARAEASAVCLQVIEDNVAARALYASLGIERLLYRYHYRRAPV